MQQIIPDKRGNVRKISRTYYRNFVISMASHFVVDARNDDINKHYVDAVISETKLLKSEYNKLLNAGGGGRDVAISIDNLLNSAFLIGLVSDRDGLSKSEAEKVFGRNRSLLANNAKWKQNNELIEIIKQIIIEIVKYRKSKRLKQTGMNATTIVGFLERDEIFVERISELGLSVNELPKNMLLSLVIETRKSEGC